MNARVPDPVRTTVPEAVADLPAVWQARQPDLLPFLDWLAAHRDTVEATLAEVGAVLFRGVDAATPERFERVVRTLSPALKNDYLGTSPRDGVTDHVFEASGLPGYYPIPQHCEMTFVKQPPARLFFGCMVAPERHGETPLVDFRRVWDDLDPAVRERFETRGVRIIRNYAAPGQRGGMFQLKAWDAMFQTRDRDVAQAKAEAEDFEVTWLPDGGLRLVSHHPAGRIHAPTGRMTWFNHSQVFHIGAAAGEYRRIQALRPHPRTWAMTRFAEALVGWQRLTTDPIDQPMHTTFDDGSEISEADMDAVREAIWKNMARVPWQPGDVVAIDNFAVSHGRMPYSGPRNIVVAWT